MSPHSDKDFRYVTLLRPLTEAALANLDLRPDLLPLIKLGKAERQVDCTLTLRDRMVRLAFFTESPRLKNLLLETVRRSDAEVERRALIREAYYTTDADRRRQLLSRVAGTKVAAYSPLFTKFVQGKRFHNPETNEKVLFNSLPGEAKKQIHEQWVAGRKQWAQDFKPEGLDEATEMTPASFDSLEEGDKFWVSWSPRHLHEVVGKGKSKKGKPYVDARLVDRHTGEPVEDKPRRVWRSSVFKDDYEFRHVPEGHEVSAVPEHAGKAGVQIDWDYELEHEGPQAKPSVVPTPKKPKGEQVTDIDDLKVGDYFTMQKGGKTHLMQVVKAPGTDHFEAVPVHADSGAAMMGAPISVGLEDLGTGTYVSVKPPKPKDSQHVKNTGQVSTGDFISFGIGSGNAGQLMKVVKHSGEVLHAVPVDPVTGETLGTAQQIDSHALTNGRTYKIPAPKFTPKPAEKAKPSVSVFHPPAKSVSLSDVEDFMEEHPEATGEEAVEAVTGEPEPLPDITHRPHHAENVRDWNGTKSGIKKILKQMKSESSHSDHPDWMEDAINHLKDVLTESSKGAQKNGMTSVAHHYDNLLTKLHEMHDDLVDEHKKGVKPGDVKFKKFEPTPEQIAEHKPKKEPKPKPKKKEKAKAPEHKPTGKHKDRKELRGVPKKKMSDKSDIGRHHFMQSLIAPEGMPEELRTQAKAQLQNATYQDIGTILRNIEHMRASPDSEHTKELQESGYTDEDLDHIEHVLKQHMQDVHGRLYHPDMLPVANQHDLESEDLDELYQWKRHSPKHGKKLSPQELFNRFLKHAKPETKSRMQGMPLSDFMVMYKAIMKDTDEEGGAKTAAFLRKMASYYGVDELSPEMRSLIQ